MTFNTVVLLPVCSSMTNNLHWQQCCGNSIDHFAITAKTKRICTGIHCLTICQKNIVITIDACAPQELVGLGLHANFAKENVQRHKGTHTKYLSREKLKCEHNSWLLASDRERRPVRPLTRPEDAPRNRGASGKKKTALSMPQKSVSVLSKSRHHRTRISYRRQ